MCLILFSASMPASTARRKRISMTLIEHHDLGRKVVCDDCGTDWTDRPESGGLIYGSHAVCPDCAPKAEADLVRLHEEHLIGARCPPGKSFADWVRDDLREGEPGFINLWTL